MTKRHFEAFARTIKADLDRGTPREQCEYAAKLFAQTAASCNDRFDWDRFMKACGLR